MASDAQIAASVPLEPIQDVALRAGLPAADLVPYGRHVAKLATAPAAERAAGRVVLVTAITPTPAGEGKTLTAIGLALALCRLGRRATCTLRQASLGPVFGLKGGAAGGGRAQVLPLEALNLHLTGDFHAVAAANNLCAAALDTSLLLDNPLAIDPEQVSWRRVIDVNDRALRAVRIGLGGPRNGIPRDTSFEITAASEVMAVLGLASDLADLRARLGRIVVAESLGGRMVTAEDLGVAGAMAALVRDALRPNVLQTSEGTLAFVHTGPFANVAHGCSSIVADRLAARFFDWVVTEAGFGADLGAEKFFDIKCRASGTFPEVAVLVVTVRALKAQSGRFAVRQGAPLPPELEREDPGAVEEGAPNLRAQVGILERFGVPVVCAVNRFASDSPEELGLVRRLALEAGCVAAEVSEAQAKGGAGALELARAVVEAAESGRAAPRMLYALERPTREKIHLLATEVYGAGAVQLSPLALEKLARLEARGFGALPICMAKTQYSLSHDPSSKGRPRGFVLPVRDLRLAAGAGFLVVHSGEVSTMPGLGRRPGYLGVDLDAEGRIAGLA
jgi:formate--tetrahydrofolate ligase